MRKLTMKQYRETIGSQCTIPNCADCTDHARENDIEIVKPPYHPLNDHPTDFLLKAGQGLGLSGQAMMSIVEDLDKSDEILYDDMLLEDAEDFFVFIVLSLAKADTPAQTQHNLNTIAEELHDLTS